MRRLLAGIVGLAIVSAIAGLTHADDSSIAQQLSADLRTAKSNRELQSFRISVKVESGVVWMKGTVRDADQKSRALQIARAVPGVRLVVNDLTIEGEALTNTSPAEKGTAPLTSRALESPRSESLSPIAVNSGPKKSSDANAARTRMPEQAADIQQVSGYSAAQRRVPRGNAVVPPSAAMTARAYAGAPHPMMMPALADPQAMQAAMLQSQLMQQELLQRQAMALAMQRMQAQPAGPQHQLVNYCADGGCGMGGFAGGVGMGRAGGGLGMGAGGGMGMAGMQPANLGPGMPSGAAFGADFGHGHGVVYDQAQLPSYAWPSYSSYPNYASLSYPKQYSPQAWPYIGPFYPYPQVPLGWRKVTLEWDDGWWMLDFKSK